MQISSEYLYFQNSFKFHLEPLPAVFQLFQGKDVFIEILLELFICIVNIKLFKTVYLKREDVLKNVYIQSILLCK